MHTFRLFLAFGLVSSVLIQIANADTLVYQCRQKNGHINFSDSPCRVNEKHIAASIIKPMEQTHSVVSVAPKDEPQQTRYIGPRADFGQIERDRISEQNRQWSSVGRVGVTVENSPSTYGYTKFANR
jgi:hypothetical protein